MGFGGGVKSGIEVRVAECEIWGGGWKKDGVVGDGERGWWVWISGIVGGGMKLEVEGGVGGGVVVGVLEWVLVTDSERALGCGGWGWGKKNFSNFRHPQPATNHKPLTI